MKINDMARLAGITVRTLRYYDEIGLLPPAHTTPSGYRVYDESSLERLQQILFFRELDFPLSEIKELLDSPDYNRNEAMRKQEVLLLQKRDRLNGLLTLLRRRMKGENDMSFSEFDNQIFETTRRQYADEAKQRWGETQAYTEYADKTALYTDAAWNGICGDADGLLREFGQNRTLPPDSPAAHALVRQWQRYITEHFYECTDEILLCLAQMYTEDKRFCENIDRHGSGTAAFMASAILSCCSAGH